MAVRSITISTLPDDLRVRILSLPRDAGWDGEDAEAITPATCQAALSFLEDVVARNPGVPLPASVAPTVLGGVSLYWKEDCARLLVEIGMDPDQVHFQQSGPNELREQGI